MNLNYTKFADKSIWKNHSLSFRKGRDKTKEKGWFHSLTVICSATESWANKIRAVETVKEVVEIRNALYFIKLHEHQKLGKKYFDFGDYHQVKIRKSNTLRKRGNAVVCPGLQDRRELTLKQS